MPKCLGKVFSALHEVATESDLRAFGALVYALGIDLFEAAPEAQSADVPSEIAELAQKRWDAKKSRDFALADELRAQIKAAGWEVFDKKDGFDIKKL